MKFLSVLVVATLLLVFAVDVENKKLVVTDGPKIYIVEITAKTAYNPSFFSDVMEDMYEKSGVRVRVEGREVKKGVIEASRIGIE